MIFVVKTMEDVNPSLIAVLKRAKQIVGYDAPVLVIEEQALPEHTDEVTVGMGVNGCTYKTLSPKQVLTKGTSLTFLTQVMHNAVNHDTAQTVELVLGKNYWVLETEDDVKKLWGYFVSRTPDAVSIDIETGGNADEEPWGVQWLLSISLTVDDTHSYVIPEELAETETTAAFIDALCNNIPVTTIGHNSTYDAGLLSHRLGIKVYFDEDTLMMHFCMNNTAQEHGLKPLAQRIFGAADWDSANKKYTKGGAHFENIPRDQLYRYNCIGEGSPVLTDRGLVPIENVQLTDKVWDGVEWVHHEGVVCNGTQPVIDLDGLVVTPEHLILTDEGDYVCAQSIQAGLRRPAVGGYGSVPQTLSAFNREDEARASAYSVGGSLHTMWEYLLETPQLAAVQGYTEGVRLSERRQMGQGQEGASVAQQVPRNGTALHSRTPNGESSWGPRGGDALQVDGQLHYVGADQLADGGLRRCAVRSDRHTRTLRAWESEARIGSKKLDESHGQRVCAVHGAKCPAQSPVASSENGSSRLSTNSRRACAQVAAGNVGAGGNNQAVQRTARVYDILNAGPRHRFTVSGIVVSNCYDTYWTMRLYRFFHEQMEHDPAIRAYYRYRMEVTKVLQDLQANGIAIDTAKLQELGEKFTAEFEEARGVLREVTGNDDFNPNSPKQVKDWLSSQGVPVHTADKAALTDLLDSDNVNAAKFASALLTFRRANKQYSTYVVGISKRVGEDGRIHPTYLPHGAKSGRLSSRNPNAQNITRDSGIKEAFVAPEGYCIVSCDYSQAELRTVAELAADEHMIAAFQPGAPDFFDNLMTKIYPEEFPTIEAYEAFDKENHLAAKNKRAIIKGTVYGANYGRGVPAIAKALKVPVSDAQAVMDSYYGTYPNLKKWQDSVREAVGKDRLAWRLITPFGLRYRQEVVTQRTRNKAENEALSFVPQSTANDICLHAAIEVNKRLDEYGARLVCSVHDALYVEAPLDKAQAVGAMMEREMAGAAELVFHRAPFVAEAEYGNNFQEV